MFPFGEPPAVQPLRGCRVCEARKGWVCEARKSWVCEAGKTQTCEVQPLRGCGKQCGNAQFCPTQSICGGDCPRTLPTLSFCHPERSRGISRHVPVDLVRWLDFARHDRMIAADRFSDSLCGYKSVYKKEGKFRKTLHLFVRDVPRCKVRQNIG